MKRLNDCWSPMVAALILGGSPWRGPRSAAIAEPDSMPTITVASRLARIFLFVIGSTSSSGLLSWVLVHACFRLPDMAQVCCGLQAGRIRFPPLPSEAGAHADRRLVTAERAADGDHRAIADRTLVADRKRAFAALVTDADAHAILGADTGGAGGHVEHGRAHRALLVDAAVLLGPAVVDLALEWGERVVQCRELGIGVGVGRRQGLRGGGVGVGLGVGDTGVELALVHRIGGRDAVGHVGDLAFVAAGRRITVPDARSSTRARDRGFGCAASGGAAAATIVPAPVVAVAGEGLQFGDTAVEAADRAIKRTERIADVEVIAAL